MSYTIIDDFLPQEISDNIKDYMTGRVARFPWYYNVSVTLPEDTNYSLNHHQFTHVFYKDLKPHSSDFGLMEPILDILKPRAIDRIKANLNPITSEKIVYPWHVDFSESDNPFAKTAIYYVNTNNGVTMFEDGTEIESVQNRMVIFNQNMRHTGTTCTDTKIRCLINFNYITN
jgi:hypothetical protein